MITKGTRLLFILCIAAITGVQAQKIALKKGQQLQTVTSTKMTMEVMGQNMDNESTATSTVQVKDASDTGYTFTNTVNRMTLKGNGMGQDISFDSDKKEDMDGQLGQALKDYVGHPQDIQVNKKGKITSMSTEGAKGAGMGDMMGLSGQLANGQAYPILIQLPAKSVKPGDTWVDSTGTAATIKTVTTYTLKSVGADGALVSFAGTLAKSGTIQQNGMEIQMDMSGTVNGQATYETATGFLKSNTTSSDIKGTLGVMGQNMPLTAKVTVTTQAKRL